MKRLKILDCTLRDGGYVNKWNFSNWDALQIHRALSESEVDIMEMGFIRDNKVNGNGEFHSLTEKWVETCLNPDGNISIGAMVDFGSMDINNVPECKDSYLDILRIAVHRNKISNALTYIENLKEKGYITSIQLMGYSTLSKSEQLNILDLVDNTSSDYIYVADSYGSMKPEDIREMLMPLVEIPDIKIGFHPHNNLQMALINTLEAIKCGVDIVDASILGMGRGAGNLPLEMLLTILDDKYNVVPVLDCIDRCIKKYKDKYDWGYSIPYMLSGHYNCHPYYAKYLNNKYSNNILRDTLKVINEVNPIGYKPEIIENCVGNEPVNYNKDNKKITALMPMKAHSKRIPNKNIRTFNGRPLYVWMLSKLVNSYLIDEIIVDTDSNIIKTGIQERFPEVKIIDRLEHLCGDNVSMNDIISYDISNSNADIFVQTHSTNPLLKIDTVEKAIGTFNTIQPEYDSLFGVTKHKKMFWDNKSKPINHNPYKLKNTQSLNPIYVENSNIYIFTKDSFKKTKCRLGDNPYMFEISQEESFDIDEMIDFRIAENFHKLRNTKW